MSAIILIGAAAAGFLLLRKKPKVKAPPENCGRLVLTPALIQGNLAALQKLVLAIKPSSPCVETMAKTFRLYWPGCKFTKTTLATVVSLEGQEVSWQALVDVVGDKTLAQAESDPAVIALLGARPRETVTPGTVPEPGSSLMIGVFW